MLPPAHPRPQKVKDMASLACAEAKSNAALLGPPGAGKTHIAVALAVAACWAGLLDLLHHPGRHGSPARTRRCDRPPDPQDARLRVPARARPGRGRLPATGPRGGQPGLPDDQREIRERLDPSAEQQIRMHGEACSETRSWPANRRASRSPFSWCGARANSSFGMAQTLLP
ncbi:ATP-binding protein [Microbispora sitophila]|uniref:ATP-binding protein n=1 Tax=Microbispora sitophila TaxID=2771537 RepID=UPI00384AB676